MKALPALASADPSHPPPRTTGPVFPLLLTFLLWTHSALPVEPVHLPSFQFSDKALHYLFFGFLTTLYYRAFCSSSAWSRAHRHPLLFSLGAAFLTGLGDECIQSFSPYRFTEALDLAADAAGALTALLAYRFLPLYRHLLEFPLFPQPSKP